MANPVKARDHRRKKKQKVEATSEASEAVHEKPAAWSLKDEHEVAYAKTKTGCYLSANEGGGDSGPLFPGDSQYGGFRKILKGVVQEQHSIRKGAITFC